VGNFLLFAGMTKVGPIGSPSQRIDHRSKPWNDKGQNGKKARAAISCSSEIELKMRERRQGGKETCRQSSPSETAN